MLHSHKKHNHMNIQAGQTMQGTSKVVRNSDGAILTDIGMSNWTILGNSKPDIAVFSFDESSNSSVLKLNGTGVKAGSGILNMITDIVYEDENGQQQTETGVQIQGAYTVAAADGSLGVTISFTF